MMASNASDLAALRVVFMGTPAFAVPALNALADAGHDIVGVYTQPDRRSGRGRRVTAPPVKQAAMERGLLVYQPASLRRDEEARREIASLEPDLIVVAAYGLFLPAETLAVPPLGALNIHPSMLPKLRGPSPVATAILEGNTTTGVTVMQLDEGMDTGPIVAQIQTEIGSSENTENLTARLFNMGAKLPSRHDSPVADRERFRRSRSANLRQRLRGCSSARTAKLTGLHLLNTSRGRCGRTIPGRELLPTGTADNSRYMRRMRSR